MKNFYKITVVIALIAIIVFSGTACSKKEGGAASVGRASPATDFSYNLTNDSMGIVITKYTGNDNAVVIPSIIEDMPVLEIGMAAFAGAGSNSAPNNRDAITSVVVLSGVEIIGGGAFERMDNLVRVTLPDSIKVIGNDAFGGNPKLATINLPSNTDLVIGSRAFWSARELTDLIIPDSLSNIKYGHVSMVNQGQIRVSDDLRRAFQGCQKLPLKTRQ